MLENYLPILVFIIIGLGFGVFLELVGYFAAPRKDVADKLEPFECGFDAFDDSRHKFDIRFYLVAILVTRFLVFSLILIIFYLKNIALQVNNSFFKY